MHIFQSQEILLLQEVMHIQKVVSKNCAPFNECSPEINGTRVDEPKFINIIMPMYSLIEHSDNYSDTSGSLWGFKRGAINTDANVCIAKSLFIYI